MGYPCEPLTPRQELIAELEELGYDTMPGVQRDWTDWRDRLSDGDLRRIATNINASFAQKDRMDHASGETADAEEEPDYPDISEMVDTIRQAEKALAAGQTMLAGNDYTDGRSLFTNTPFYAPLVACRVMLHRIDRLLETFSASEAEDHD